MNEYFLPAGLQFSILRSCAFISYRYSNIIKMWIRFSQFCIVCCRLCGKFNVLRDFWIGGNVGEIYYEHGGLRNWMNVVHK